MKYIYLILLALLSTSAFGQNFTLTTLSMFDSTGTPTMDLGDNGELHRAFIFSRGTLGLYYKYVDGVKLLTDQTFIGAGSGVTIDSTTPGRYVITSTAGTDTSGNGVWWYKLLPTQFNRIDDADSVTINGVKDKTFTISDTSGNGTWWYKEKTRQGYVFTAQLRYNSSTVDTSCANCKFVYFNNYYHSNNITPVTAVGVLPHTSYIREMSISHIAPLNSGFNYAWRDTTRLMTTVASDSIQGGSLIWIFWASQGQTVGGQVGYPKIGFMIKRVNDLPQGGAANGEQFRTGISSANVMMPLALNWSSILPTPTRVGMVEGSILNVTIYFEEKLPGRPY